MIVTTLLQSMHDYLLSFPSFTRIVAVLVLTNLALSVIIYHAYYVGKVVSSSRSSTSKSEIIRK